VIRCNILSRPATTNNHHHCRLVALFLANKKWLGEGGIIIKNNNNNVARGKKSLWMLQHVHASLFSYGFLRFALDSLDFGSQADDAGVHSIGLCTVQEKKKSQNTAWRKKFIKIPGQASKKKYNKKRNRPSQHMFSRLRKKKRLKKDGKKLTEHRLICRLAIWSRRFFSRLSYPYAKSNYSNSIIVNFIYY